MEVPLSLRTTKNMTMTALRTWEKELVPQEYNVRSLPSCWELVVTLQSGRSNCAAYTSKRVCWVCKKVGQGRLLKNLRNFWAMTEYIVKSECMSRWRGRRVNLLSDQKCGLGISWITFPRPVTDMSGRWKNRGPTGFRSDKEASLR